MSQTSQMSHVSIELAEQIKKVGLEWVPKERDRLYYDQKNLIVLAVQEYDLFVACGVELFSISEHPERSLVWLPFLSQLMAEIEGRGYLWNLDHSTGRYLCQIGKWKWEKCLWADTTDDAAAMALLWILNRQKEDTQKEIAQKEGVPR